ncbi:MAG TPA: hypothetical protein VH934_21140 [Xanthobacteraceae bacterium]
MLSAAGRVGRRPFALGILVVYATALLSQILLSPAVTLRAGLVPFALAQAFAIWSWYCLHAKRLRDAGRDPGAAVAIAVLYALAIVLLLLILALMLPSADLPGPGAADGMLIAVRRLAGAIGRPDLGLFGYVVAGIAALAIMPMLLAVGFSVWAGTLRSAAALRGAAR